MNDELSTRAVMCTAHLMLLQNPKARIGVKDWVPFLCLVKDWCAAQEINGVRYYYEPSFQLETDMTVSGRLH